MQAWRLLIFIIGSVVFLQGCNSDKDQGKFMFKVLDSKITGLDFSNNLKATPEFNLLKYMYFYNGAGVGAGDFNNDGKTDLFFASNQSRNRIYLNQGNFRFKDISDVARIPDDNGWSTGISIADVNDDGMLDIYVCRVGHYESLQSKNQLLICQSISKDGIPIYKDEAEKYGLDFSGFSTQAAFFDYDLDGDLDMFLLNHSLRYNSTFAPRQSYNNTSDSLSGDYIFRKDGDHYTDVSKESGINRSIIGYGLGIVVSDINLDGYPDLYIGNDFHENDYLYINNGKGGFKDVLTDEMMHTSQFSMGVDAADINNDGWPEIIAADMLPSDPYILKRSLGEDEYNTFQVKIRNGYNYQYARNTLQLNRGNGHFSETGLFSNVYATDWSWATLWMDFDNDGLKDLFVSNGIPKRLNDIDYINYVSNDEIQAKIRSGQLGERDMALIDKFPQIKLPNRFFRNKGNIEFEDVGPLIKNDQETFSNGAVYADFDNDGDLDVVVNNIDADALIYENTTNDTKEKPSIKVELIGSKGNRNAIGAKLIVFSDSSIQSYEKFPVHGFQSAMEIPFQFGLSNIKIDSLILIWPNNSYQRLQIPRDSQNLKIAYKPGLPRFNYQSLQGRSAPMNYVENITARSGLLYKHEENPFIEFDREPLMPFMVSKEGPALSVGDFNGDQLDDVFIGSSKGFKSAVFTQDKDGRFTKVNTPDLDMDSTYEDIDAIWIDVNKDGYNDLIVASGGNEYFGKSEFLQPRLYLNDGKNNLSRQKNVFPEFFINAGSVTSLDFDKDGYEDLLIGGRSVPWEYGTIPHSYLLRNDGKGHFIDVTATNAPDLSLIGFSKQTIAFDIDKDGDQDILMALEWDGLCVLLNENGRFSKKFLTDKKGWWNFLLPVDIDNDGDIDLVAGNEGLNSRFRASDSEPVRMYYNDFDKNGKKEQLVTYYHQGRELVFANKADLEKQMPSLKKKFLYAEDFAKADMKQIFDGDAISSSKLFTANYFSNAVFINDGKLNFKPIELPWQAQLTSYKSGASFDVNNDGLQDIILGGNFYPNNIQMGRYDADYGTLLINKGQGRFEYLQLTQEAIKGCINRIKPITLAGKNPGFVLARNDDSVIVLQSIKL